MRNSQQHPVQCSEAYSKAARTVSPKEMPGQLPAPLAETLGPAALPLERKALLPLEQPSSPVKDCIDADKEVALLIVVLWVGVDNVRVTFLNGSKS